MGATPDDISAGRRHPSSLETRLFSHQALGEESMSFLITEPAALTAAAGNLAGIGSVMSAQNAVVAGPTTGLSPAAADEVSALVTAAAFAAHGALYQEISAQAATIHQLFVATLEPPPVRMRPPRQPTRPPHADTRGISMDFAALPPEINSGRMYSGPGPGPMLESAAGWGNVAGNCPPRRPLTLRWSPA